MATRFDKGVLSLYRVYGEKNSLENFDEYVWARSAQRAVDRVRGWYSEDGCKVLEVAKVVKSWK